MVANKNIPHCRFKFGKIRKERGDQKEKKIRKQNDPWRAQRRKRQRVVGLGHARIRAREEK